MNNALSKLVFNEQTKHFSQRLLEIRSWSLNEIQFPILDITFSHTDRQPFRVCMVCENYDESPCAIELLNLKGEFLIQTPTGSNVINQGKHPNTKRPFICSPGSLEYHTHTNHLNDLWENYRGKSGFDIGGMISQIHNAWLKTIDVS